VPAGILRSTAALAGLAPSPLPGGSDFVSPLQFSTTGDDNLRVGLLALAGPQTVRVRGRFVRLDGSVEYFSHDHTAAGDRTLHTSDFKLGEGYILNLTAVCTSGSPQIGSLFCVVQVIRGLGGATELMGVLLQGYVTSTIALAWPGSPIVHPLDGPGNTATWLGTDPALGAEWNEIVPAGLVWRVCTVRAVLVTSAVVATRRPILIYDNGTDIDLSIVHPETVGASGSTPFQWMIGGTYTDGLVGFGQVASLPGDRRLGQLYRLRTSTLNLQAGDQWTAIRLGVEQWMLAN
jgi:hypothetical protein